MSMVLAVCAGASAPSKALADSPRAPQSERPIYVVAGDGVHVISEFERLQLQLHPCKPGQRPSWFRPPAGVAQHCHGRLFASGKLTRTRIARAAVEEAGTGETLSAGYALWGHSPLMRLQLDAELGGGTGLDGEFTYKLAVGHAFSVPGPVLRGGMNLTLRGGPGFWYSRWELPAGEIGWLFADGSFTAELGARAGFLIVGRFNVLGSREELGTDLGWGSYGVASWRGTQVRAMLLAELSRFERNEPVHDLDVRLCSGTSTIMLCTRAEYRWATDDQALAKLPHPSIRAATIGFSAAIAAP